MRKAHKAIIIRKIGCIVNVKLKRLCVLTLMLLLSACASASVDSASYVNGENSAAEASDTEASGTMAVTGENDMTEKGAATWLPAENGTGEQILAKNTGVVYEIFVGSFADSNGDGIGDLKGIEEKLDYIAALGACDIWMTPIHPSDSYHHYDVIDYLDISPQFGTMEDLKSLIQACHEHGMKLYLDLVINHTSYHHPWFLEGMKQYKALKDGNESDGQKTDYAAYYNFSDQSAPQYAGTTSGVWYEACFGEHMPDLNLDNEEVRAEIKRITDFYLDLGIDGFRLDASLYYYNKDSDKNVEFVSWLNETVKEKKPDAYIVSETWVSFSALQKYYTAGIDSYFAFDFSDSNGLFSSCIKTGKGKKLAERFAEENARVREITDGTGVDAIFLSNHDQGRCGGWFTKPELSKLAAAVYLLSPGKPFMYYGEEIGMRGSGIDQNKRMAMQWGEGADCKSPDTCDYSSQITDTVLSEVENADSLLNTYHSLLATRALYPWLTYAEAKALDLGDEALFGIIAIETVNHSDKTNDGTEAETSAESTDKTADADDMKERNQIVIVHNFSADRKTFVSPLTEESTEIEGYASMILEIGSTK